MTDLPLLTIVVALPFLGALVALLLPRAAVWWWALLVALLDLVATLAIFAQFQAGRRATRSSRTIAGCQRLASTRRSA